LKDSLHLFFLFRLFEINIDSTILKYLNMDEFGLLYLALPTSSYVSLEEGSRKTIRGTKALPAKDRVTLVLCVNATETCKIAPLIVWTSKNPHFFPDSPCPIPYVDQRHVWVDREVYKGWWLDIFLPAIRKFTKEPVALLMDYCPMHDWLIQLAKWR
jgi:hypothetical protein